MNEYLPVLKKCTLFKGIEAEEILSIFKSLPYRINSYTTNEMIALEGESCVNLGIILKGTTEARKISPSGKAISMAQCSESEIFGEPNVYSSSQIFPATIFAITDTKILFIHRKDISMLCQKNPCFMENFMQTLSDKTLFLTQKIHLLYLTTIRQKICSYLLELYKEQNSLTITLPITRIKMAELLGVQRPSLSREFSKMKSEGLIDFARNTVIIKNLQKIEEIMFE